jgi:hypothetical protein
MLNLVLRATIMLVAASLFAAEKAHSDPVELLPPVRDPKLFRQSVDAECELPDLAPGLCRFRFLRVRDNRLVEVSTFVCQIQGDEGSYFLFRKATPDINPPYFKHVVATFIPGRTFPAGGPYYFTAGEQVVIWGETDTPNSPIVPNRCTIFGKMYRTD